MLFEDLVVNVEKGKETNEFHTDSCSIGDYYIFRGYGCVDPIYGGEEPILLNMGPGLAAQFGAVANDKVLLQSTVLGINPQFVPPPGDRRAVEKINNCTEYLKIMHGRYKDFKKIASVPFAIFALYYWDTNYQHFIVETYPRIWIASHFARRYGLPIIVLDAPHIRELITLTMPDLVRHCEVIYVQKDEAVEVTQGCLWPSAIGQNMARITPAQAEALRSLRRHIVTAADTVDHVAPEGRRVFLYRMNLASNTAGGRLMSNIDAFVEIVQKRGFSTVVLENKTLPQKRDALRGAGAVVSPAGANLINLLFLDRGARLLVLSHPGFGAFPFFEELFRTCEIELERCELFLPVTSTEPEKNPGLSAYDVHLPSFELQLDALLA